MPARRRMAAAAAAAGAVTALVLAAAPAVLAQPTGPVAPTAYLSHFHKIKTIASTVPHNGDVNPYGIFIVRHSTGRLHAGSILISNFNNKANLQGTGSTIVQITPSGHRTLFARISASKLPGACPGGVGLSTALEILPGGWVVVGSVPSSNGMAATAKAGCLIVVNRWGKVAETISGHGINGPWDSAAVVRGHFAALFVSNVLRGTVAANGKVVHRGYVLRLILRLHGFAAPTVVFVDNDRLWLSAADRPCCVRARAHWPRLRTARHALRRRDADQPDLRHPARAHAPGQRRPGRPGNQARQAEHAAWPRHRPERPHPHGQRRQRQDRGDDAGRRPDLLALPGHLGQPQGRGCTLRPGRAARPAAASTTSTTPSTPSACCTRRRGASWVRSSRARVALLPRTHERPALLPVFAWLVGDRLRVVRARQSG